MPRHARLLLTAILLSAVACDGGATSDAGTRPDTGAPADAAAAEDGGADAGGADGGGSDAGQDAGGADAGPLDPASFTVAVVEGDLEFGSWSCGATAPAARTVRVTNDGPSRGSFLVRVGPDYAAWFVLEGTLGGELAPGASATFTVRPQIAPGAQPLLRTAITEQITAAPLGEAIGGLSVNASFTATGGYPIVGDTHAFGDQSVGSTSSYLFSVRNPGDQSVTFAVAASLPAPYTLELPGLAAGMLTVAPDTIVNGTIRFAPTQEGEFEGSVSFEPRSAVCRSIIGPVSVTGAVRAGSLRVSGDVDFGESRCGTMPTAQSVTVSNAGGSSLAWSAALGRGASSAFTLTPASGTIAAGGSATIMVRPDAAPFTPAVPLDLGDLLNITAGADSRTIALRHRAGGAVIRWVDARTVELRTLVGQPATAEFTVENAGTEAADLAVRASMPSAVTFAGATDLRLGAGERHTVRVVYTPTATDVPRQVSLSTGVTDACSTPDAEVSPVLQLRPRGAANLVVGADSLVFGAVPCGLDPAPLYLPVTNLTTGPLEVEVRVDGSFGVAFGGAPVTDRVTLPPGAHTLMVTAPPRSGTGPQSDVGSIYLRLVDTPWQAVHLSATRYGAVLVAEGSAMGTVPAGATMTQTVRVGNAGSSPVTMIVAHDAASEAHVVTIAAGATERVEFSRLIPTGAFSDLVRLTQRGGTSGVLCGAPPTEVRITGEGTLSPSSVDTTSVALGDNRCGGTPPSGRTVRVRNHAMAAVTFSAAFLGAPPMFDVAPASGTIPARGTITLDITPRAIVHAEPGEQARDLAITTPSAAHVVRVSQIVRGMIVSRDATMITLPDTSIGEVSRANVRVTTRGNELAPLLFDESDPMSELSVTADTIAGPGRYHALFSPALVGTRTFSVDVRAPAGAALCAPLPSGSSTLTGRGIGEIGLDVAPTSVDFGPAGCGTRPSARGFVVENRGDAPLSFTITRPAPSWFGVSPSSGTVPVGGRATITVTPLEVPRTFDFENPVPHVRAEEIVVSAGAASRTVELRATAVGAVYQIRTNFYPDPSDPDVTVYSPVTGWTVGAYTFPTEATAPCIALSRAQGGCQCPTAGGGTCVVRAEVDPRFYACSPIGVTWSGPP
ncbi:MAG: choice-of-anchor D domain-containing protein [Sandaracinaceae bacterium]|nr:choice-of-anchor D domain-containing protein [Sandaracinaceae bacterium]